MMIKTRYTKPILPLLIALLMLSACGRDRSKFHVEGTITGAVGETLFLEHQSLTAVEPIDSLLLDETGSYEFSGEAPDYPEFYRLRLGQQVIPFSIDSIETLTITSDAQSFATGYSVEGSHAAEQIKEVWLAQLDANVAMARLVKNYDTGALTYERFAHLRDSILDSYKVGAQQMIFDDPTSPVAYFALFQQIDGNLIFNIYDKQDSRVFAAVANVYDAFYPESPRRDHLYNLALRSMAVVRRQARIDSLAQATPSADAEAIRRVGFIDIALPDLSDEEIRLSDIAEGHPVLLSFTVMDSDWDNAYQTELRKVYDSYADRGLRIYQVALDSDLYAWRNKSSHLPWYNVIDPDGLYSSLVGLYNVRSLPALFLIDRNGEITDRITSFDRLPDLLSEHL